MKIFLTGSTGFMGHELLKELRARGHEVTALVRSPGKAALPDGLRVVKGSVEDPATYRGELAGHDVVAHVAALVKMWARDRSDFDRTNVQGTESLVLAAAEAGVPKVVYASSFMALGPSDDRPLAEDDPRTTQRTHNDYERTKHAADRIARRLIEQGAPLFVLYPGVIYGPGHLTHGNIVARSVVQFLRGRMPFGIEIRDWSYAYVGDVVSGFVRVIETEAPSRRYILGGDNKSGAEFYAALQRVTGKKPPRVNIPLPMAKVAGRAEHLLAELTGREPSLLTHEVADIYARSWAYDSSRAIRELGYTITPLEEGLRRMVSWLRTAGHL